MNPAAPSLPAASEPVVDVTGTESRTAFSASRNVVLIKIVGSALIALHLLAVFSAPATVGPSSDLERDTWSVLSPYLHVTNLNFGYHFFAPEPSSTTLIEYKGVRADGQEVWGRIPDRKTMVPRLLYHRYFMLTEYLGNRPPSDPMRRVLIRNYADQIMKNHQLQSVTLTQVTHRLLPRERVLLGTDINAPETFDHRELGVFEWTQK